MSVNRGNTDSPLGLAIEAESPARGQLSSGRLVRTAFLNSVASLLDYAAWLVVGLVSNPILVHVLGGHLFGIWRILRQSVEYIGYADGQGSQALKWVIAKHRETAGPEQLRRYAGAAVGCYLIFSPLLVLAGGVIVWLSPFLTNAALQDHSTVRLACAILVLSFFLGMLMALPEAVLRGMNMGYKRMGLQALITLLGGTLLVLAAFTGFGLPGMAWAQVIAAVVGTVLFWRICASAIPWFGFSAVSIKETLQFVGLSGWYLAWSVVDGVLRGSDLIILGYLASPTFVTIYVLSRFAAETSGKIIRTVVFGMLPGLGGVIGHRHYQKASFLRSQIMSATWLFAVAVGATILMWNRSFVSLWIGEELYGGSVVNILTVLLFIQMAMTYNDAAILSIALQPVGLVIWGLVGAAVSIILSFVLTPTYGITGLCWALLIGRGFISFAYPKLVSKLFGVRQARRCFSAIRAAVVGLALLTVGAILGSRLIVTEILNLLGLSALSFLAFSAFMLFGALNKAQRQVFLDYARKIRFQRAL